MLTAAIKPVVSDTTGLRRNRMTVQVRQEYAASQPALACRTADTCAPGADLRRSPDREDRFSCLWEPRVAGAYTGLAGRRLDLLAACGTCDAPAVA